ncbi:MAG: hypothetical protein EHM20_15985 [Alphaproteobacteria bacterium]|nr:MAG: hypothetical protein EHM20_15985 [Alphaproteobacteria bacterium]
MIKIGIPAQDQPENKFGVNTNYLRFIYQFGHPVVILPETYDNFSQIYKLDALLLPGGADVNTHRYSNTPDYGTYNSNNFLEHFDTEILPKLIGEMPIFGICRGLQTLNVLFGGTLKNLWFHPYSINDTDTVHKIYVSGEKKPLKVNSFHHQAIGKLAGNLTKEAQSEDLSESIIEAISDHKKHIFAVQWHPERLLDEYSVNNFKKILGL